MAVDLWYLDWIWFGELWTTPLVQPEADVTTDVDSAWFTIVTRNGQGFGVPLTQNNGWRVVDQCDFAIYGVLVKQLSH